MKWGDNKCRQRVEKDCTDGRTVHSTFWSSLNRHDIHGLLEILSLSAQGFLFQNIEPKICKENVLFRGIAIEKRTRQIFMERVVPDTFAIFSFKQPPCDENIT